MAEEKEKVSCPECGNPVAATYLAGHLRNRHGIYGGKSGKPRPKRQKRNGKSKALVPLQNGAHPVAKSFRKTPFIILVDEDGAMWLAEPLGRKG